MTVGKACSATGQAGAVAAGHPLAAGAGALVLRSGGSAVDATLAAHAVISVVLPEAGGLGGDALALVHDSGRLVAVNGTGVLPAAAGLPTTTGGASVTVPGAVDGWLVLHREYGRLPLSDVFAPAIRLAQDGFLVEPSLRAAVGAQRIRLLAGGSSAWSLLDAETGEHWRQPELARCLLRIATDGRSAFYEGEAAGAMTAAAAAAGGALSRADLAEHTTEVGWPLATAWHGGRLYVQPPMSQGVLLAMAAQWVDRHADGIPVEDADHVMVEATEASFAFREDCALGERLLAEDLSVDPARAARRGGPRSYLHTAGVAAVDSHGQVVSSLLSVFDDFGSGVFVPELGFVLNNRAAGFTVGRNSPAPGKRPVHTLAPALLVQDDGSVLALATPGADGQVQTLLQVLWRLRRGEPLVAALSAPRWRSQDGSLLVESSHPRRHALAARGHRILSRPDGDDLFGGVVAAGQVRGRLLAAGDWRRRVACAGADTDHDGGSGAR